jgi:predicted transport protein
LDSYKAFPTDEAFEAEFLAKDVYHFRSCKYLLEKIENHDKKERISADNYTIEHIMPQNTKNSPEWKEELGENRKEVYEKYLHTIGNVTLTWYNSEYSDKSFQDKKTMEGKGFNASPVWLNGMIKNIEKRNEEAIISRAKELANFAKHVWPYEKLSDEVFNKYITREAEVSKHEWTYATHKYLTGETMSLFQKFKEKLLSFHPDVKEEIQKLYIAFKYQTNFVDVEPQKTWLRLTINMDFEEIKDPRGICRDVTGIGRWGNGNVSVHLKDEADLDYVLWLVKQSFEKQFE